MSGHLLHIERGIPVPPPQVGGGCPPGRTKRVPWRRMRVGDSVLVRAAKTRRQKMQMALATNARRVSDETGAKFATRQVEGGVRVWRTA